MPADDERTRIGDLLRGLTARYGVVLDDVVLRTWDNRNVDTTYGMLGSALAASGGTAEESDLRAVARAISHGEALPPRPQRAG